MLVWSMADKKFRGLEGKESNKTAKELFSAISDLLDMDVVGNIVFARGRNETGKTLAMSTVGMMATYYAKVRNCPVHVVYAPMAFSADYESRVSSGEARAMRVEEALSSRLNKGTSIVMIDDFALLSANRQKKILKTLSEKIESKRVAFALIGEISDDEKLGIWKDTKR
jgi:Cdc6-like AAA superfamily ATPase